MSTAAATFVPIVVTLDDGQAEAKTRSLGNAMRQLDATAERTGRGGLSNAFNATRLLDTELYGLASRIPVVGRLFGALDLQALRFAGSAGKVSQELKTLQAGYKTFQSALSQVNKGKSPVVADLLKDFGIDAEKGLRAPKAAFAKFIEEFQRFPDPAGRARIASDVFGASAAKLLPILENDTGALEAAGAGATGMGGSFLSALGPIGLTLAALVAVVAIGGAAFFGLFKLAQGVAETADKYYDLGQQVNFSAHTFSAIDVAAAQSGVKIESINAGLGIFDKKLEEAAEKSTKLGRVLKASGVDVHDNEKALIGLFAILSKLPEGETQTALAMEAFGKSGKSVLAVVKQAHGDLPTLIRLLDDMGATISNKDAAAAHEFDEKLELLQKQFDATKVKVGSELLPIFEQLFDDLSGWLTKNQGEIRAWGETFASVASGMMAVIRELKSNFADMLSMWRTVQSLTPSATNDPHTGGQSYAGRFWQWATGPSDAKSWEQGTGTGTTHMATPAEIDAQGRAARQTGVDADAAARKAREEKAREAARVSHLMGEKSHHGGGKHHANAADQAARAEMREAEVDVKTAERLYREATSATEREYKTRAISLDAFVAKQIEAENTLAVAKADALKLEEAAAQKLSKGPERNLKLKEVHEKEAALQSETRLKIQKILDDADEKQLASLTAHQGALLDSWNSYNSRASAALDSAAERGLISFESAEQQKLDLQTAFFDKRLVLLAAEETRNVNNVEEFRRINDEIAKLTDEKTVAQEESERRIEAARRKDIENARAHARELGQIELENLKLAVEIGNARLDAQERLGAQPDDVTRGRAALDVKSENILHKEREAEIKAARDSIDVAKYKYNAEQRAQIEEAFRQRSELETLRHSDKLAEIQQRPLEEYRKKVREFAQDVGSIVGDSFDALFKKGESFWKSLEQGFADMFRQIVRDFIASKVKETIESLFEPKSSKAAQTSQSKGGGFSLKSLFNFGGNNSSDDEGSSGSSGGGGFNIAGAVKGYGGGGGFKGALKGLLGFGGAGASAASSSAAALPTAFPAAASAAIGPALSGGAGAAGAGGGAAAGAGGASGGMGASLMALAANPLTWIVAGAAVGGFLLWRHFSHRDEKALKKEIMSAYQLDVKDMNVLSQVKAIGESAFGKGHVRQHVAEVVRLEPSKELLAQYADSTGQTNSALVKNRELQDAANPQNQFTRRAMGGPVSAGVPYIVGDRGPRQYWEVFVPQQSGHIMPSLDEYEATHGSPLKRVMQKLREAQQRAVQSSGPVSSGFSRSSGGGSSDSTLTAMQATLERLASAMETFETADEGAVVQRGLKKNPRTAMDAVNTAAKQGHGKESLQKNLGL